MNIFSRGLQAFWGALRTNWLPALGIWALGTIIVAGYYSGGVIREAADAVAELRARSGLVYPVVAMILFGAILPGATQLLLFPKERRNILRRTPFLFPYWAWKGLEVEFFYMFQAWLFGAEASLVTTSCKVAVDMFIYNPAWATPTQAIFFRWLAIRNGELPAGEKLFPKNWYSKLSMPLLVATWALWFPAVTLIYMLPTTLQLPLANLILWLWSMMLVIMARDHR
jgi:hypothetical protein